MQATQARTTKLLLRVKPQGNRCVLQVQAGAELRIDKGDENVASSFGYWQTFVIVRQTARVDERPTWARFYNAAVVADKSATAALVIGARFVQGNVQCVRGRIVVGPQRRLLRRMIPNNEG